jgi:hypothetical protein
MWTHLGNIDVSNKCKTYGSLILSTGMNHWLHGGFRFLKSLFSNYSKMDFPYLDGYHYNNVRAFKDFMAY